MEGCMESTPPLKYAQIEGKRIAYRDAGTGPAVLFLHGLGGNSATWQPQFAALSGRYRVIAWEMPGFGNSDRLDKVAANTRDFSTLAWQLVSALGIENAHAVGTSYGTVILADLVHSHPSKIRSIAFACGVTGLGHLDPAQRSRLREARRAELESMGQRKFAETRNSTYLAENSPADLVRRVVELAGSAQPEGYMEAYGALTESNIFPLLDGITIPALVMSGANDPIAPLSDCERVAAAIPGAEYHCIPNSGHYVNLEQAETFNRLLSDFIARAEQRGPSA